MWLKNNWVWLALIGVGALGLWLGSKKADPAAKAREAKAEKREAAAAGGDPPEGGGPV